MIRRPKPKQPRRRRSPEAARQELLDAAERVFVEWLPDQVGLKEIAAEAGVSHALITHYFGSYDGLIEATLERRVRALRESILERLKESGVLSRPGELLAQLFRTLQDPVHLRLTRWHLASGRPEAGHTFALREQGLQLVAHQVAAALDPRPSPVLIGKIEIALLAVVSAAYGYALGKYALTAALGRPSSRDLDLEVEHTITAMLEAHMRSELAPLLPPSAAARL